MSAPQLQWDLSRTVDSTLALTQGVIRAATTDNVQPLPLLACERFGATLVISSETCRKVESEVIKMQTPSTRVLSFLGASIGYSRDDCASHLARSQAGIQFIALAAALIPSLNAFDGGTALSIMLKDTAADKTLVPPVTQLKYLLMSLEHRCVRLGFSDQVFGWTRLLHKPSLASADFSGRTPTGYHLDRMSHVPAPFFIGKLVSLLRRLSGTGDPGSGITIRVDIGVAWLAAFIRWCIGTPPSVYLDDGTALFEGPPSRVILVFCGVNPGPNPQGIAVHIDLGRPSELITPYEGSETWHGQWVGMLRIESYGQWLLGELDLDKGLVLGIVNEVLPYVMKEVVTLLHLSSADMDAAATRTLPEDLSQSFPAGDGTAELVPFPWPKDHVIEAMLSRLLNSNGPVHLLEIPKGTTVMDLPLLKEHFPTDITGQCRCAGCVTAQEPSVDNRSICKRKNFIHSLSTFAGIVLLLSLFQFPENLLVNANQPSETKNMVGLILDTGQPVSCHFSYILKAALRLVGHDMTETKHWVISCYRGQAVYPRLFETQNPYESGYLTLCWAPGLLRHERDTYSHGVGFGDYSAESHPRSELIENNEIATMPTNMYSGYQTVWRVSPGDNILQINLGIDRINDLPKYGIIAPVTVITGLISALVIGRCAHAAKAKLASLDPLVRYTKLPPFSTSPHLDENPQAINVVPVDGNNGLRMYALGCYASQGRVVLRKDACMACCLELARKIGSRVVIC